VVFNNPASAAYFPSIVNSWQLTGSFMIMVNINAINANIEDLTLIVGTNEITAGAFTT